MATPNGTTIYAHLADGTKVDVTSGVQVLYDLVISSMDWGSGFFTADDAEPVVEIATTCGFAGYEEAAAYVESQRHSEEQKAFRANRSRPYMHPPRPHDHVLSSVGRCMWPGCTFEDGK